MTKHPKLEAGFTSGNEGFLITWKTSSGEKLALVQSDFVHSLNLKYTAQVFLARIEGLCTVARLHSLWLSARVIQHIITILTSTSISI